MSELFVDAGAWIAIADRRDRYHRTATQAYQGLVRQSRTLVTSNLVIAEAHIGIRRAIGHAPAMRFLRSMHESNRLMKIYSDPALEAEAEVILARYADQDFSFVDAVSFAVMRERDIREAFAFDRHFLTAGFSMVPTPAH